jgi:PAS domain S-box-containing protein
MSPQINDAVQLLGKHRATVAADWVEGQCSDCRIRQNLVPRTTITRQSQEFLDLLLEAAADGNLDDLETPEYARLKSRMGEMAAERLQAGMTRPESVLSFGSFKEYWLTLLVAHHGNQPDLLRKETSAICRLTDTLAILVVETARRETDERHRAMIDAVKDFAFVMLDAAGRVVSWSAGAENLKGYRPQEILGKHFSCFYPVEAIEAGWPQRELQQAAEEGRFEDEGWRMRKDGSRFWANVVMAPFRDSDGTVCGFVKVTRDLTERRKTEEQIQRQSREILELSTPVVQLWEGIVATPLIGSLDSQRTQQFMERLLERIVQTNSPVALVDITGVPTIDTQTAQHLIETITAVKLLGAQVVLTGVRPAIAQTLVHLGIDLSGVITRSSLAGGVRVAMDALKLQVVSKNGRP